jgi:hypothetical protein
MGEVREEISVNGSRPGLTSCVADGLRVASISGAEFLGLKCVNFETKFSNQELENY